MGDSLEGAAQQLALRVAHQLAQRRVDLLPATVGCDQRHPDRCGVEGPAEAVLCLSEFVLYVRVGGDVDGDSAHAVGAIVAVKYGVALRVARCSSGIVRIPTRIPIPELHASVSGPRTRN
jgi:hypothetical protein